MADLKITELSDAAALDGGEQVECVQSGSNVKVTTSEIAALAGASGLRVLAMGSVSVVNGTGLVNSALLAYTLTGNERVFLQQTTDLSLPSSPTQTSGAFTDPPSAAEMTALAVDIATIFVHAGYDVRHRDYATGELTQDGANVDLHVHGGCLDATVTFDYLVIGPMGDNSPVKVYRALLTQTGTAAPVATVLENTLGGTVVWTRTIGGVYTGTLASAFPAAKTFVTSAVNSPDGVLVVVVRDGDNAVGVSCSDDDFLINHAVEILVYP